MKPQQATHEGARVRVRKVRHETHYAQIHNTVLQDNRLSFRTRGLFAYLYSLPDNWRTSVHRLSKVTSEGRDAVRKSVRELESHGYLKRLDQGRDENNRFKPPTWLLDDRPEPVDVFPSSGNPTPTKTQSQSTQQDSPNGEDCDPSQSTQDCSLRSQGLDARRPSHVGVKKRLLPLHIGSYREGSVAIDADFDLDVYDMSLLDGMLSNGAPDHVIANTVNQRRGLGDSSTDLTNFAGGGDAA